MAGDALRVLAVACRPLPAALKEPKPDEVENDLTFLGLVGMIDPPRAEVRAAIQTARHAGIKTIMITGDHKRTAMAIASDLHMFTPGLQGLTGEELDKLSDEEFHRIAREADVYSRVSPQHKVRIVDTLKDLGEIVAMTGDGVNDAPAVKRADIGVAMGITGTDVPKRPPIWSSRTTTMPPSSRHRGRAGYLFQHPQVCLLPALLQRRRDPDRPSGHPVWAAGPALSADPPADAQPGHRRLSGAGPGDGAGRAGIMDRPPRDPKEPIINREMWWGIGVQSTLITAASLGAFLIGLYLFPGALYAADGMLNLDKVTHAQTLAFATLVFSELLRAFTARSERLSLLKLGLLSTATCSGRWAARSCPAGHYLCAVPGPDL